jgi:hypothetical protein
MLYDVQVVLKDSNERRPGRTQADRHPKVGDEITVELLTEHPVVGGSHSCQARVTEISNDDEISADEI